VIDAEKKGLFFRLVLVSGNKSVQFSGQLVVLSLSPLVVEDEKAECFMPGVISDLRNLVVGGVCVLLAACSVPISIVKPLDVSRANQFVSVQFEINKTGDYRFALLFAKKDVLVEIYEQIEIWG
jgi:hypothetical protein